jgi:hypothetical protein
MNTKNCILSIASTIFFLIAISTNVSCQIEYWGINFELNKSYRKLKFSDSNISATNIARINNEIERRNSIDSKQVNFKLGINLQHRLFDNFSMLTGANISQVGYNTPFLHNYRITGSLSTYDQGKWKNYFYIESPIMFRLKSVEFKNSFFIEFGTSVFFYLFSNLGSELNINNSSRSRFINYSVNLSTGMEFKFNKMITITGKIIHQRFLLNLRDKLINDLIVRTGIEIGLNLKIDPSTNKVENDNGG